MTPQSCTFLLVASFPQYSYARMIDAWLEVVSPIERKLQIRLSGSYRESAPAMATWNLEA